MENLIKNESHIRSLCTEGLYEAHQDIFLSALNSTLAVIAFLGNVLIIVSLKNVSLHPPSKLLLGCLSSTDLFVGLITQPIFVNLLLSPEHSKHCFYSAILIHSIGVIFCAVSLLTLTAISVDRLLALLLGLRYRQVVTLRRVWSLVAASWLSSIALAIIFNIYYHTVVYIISSIMLLCVLTSTFSYIKIYLTLRHHQAQVVHQGQPNGGGIALNVARYRKTVSSAIWVLIALVVCYLPFIIVSIFPISILRTQPPKLVWKWTVSLIMLNSSLNPFLYCWKMREVRQAVKGTIRKLWCFSS